MSAYFKSIQSLAKSLKTVIPNRCAVCDGFCNELVCARCYAGLERNTICCATCAEPLPRQAQETGQTYSSKQQCGQCLTKPPLYNKTISPFLYNNEMRQLILQFKFASNLALAHFFAKELAEALSVEFEANGLPDVVIPIPLHITRLKGRGYNQAQLLGSALSRELNIPVDYHHLKRVTLAAPQAGLNKPQRAKNIKGVFTLSNQEQRRFTYKHILLVDDVITTGATINEACKPLFQSKSGLIITVCSIARSPIFS